jgi:hypothetical protein
MGAYSDFVANKLYGGNPSGGVMTEVVNSSSTTATLTVAAGLRYVFTKPLTSLVVSKVENYAYESEIVFTAGTGITVAFPETLGWIGEPSFEAGKSYIINIRNNVAVCAAYKPGATV